MNYLTVNQLAERLSISREMVYKLMRENEDFPYVLVGKVKRFDFEDVEKWLKKSKEVK
jgi:excisionase family DNA binding protein